MDFPSGPWTGFYNYGRTTRKHRMDLVLTFADHTVSGDGSDDIGRFVITGRFEETNGECYWTKAYIAGHHVCYRGFRERKGIWGLWELPDESGGFNIWPLGYEEGEQNHDSAEEPAPLEAVAAEGYISTVDSQSRQAALRMRSAATRSVLSSNGSQSGGGHSPVRFSSCACVSMRSPRSS